MPAERFPMQDQLLSILNALEDGIFITDLMGRPLWVNRASLDQLACSETHLFASDVYRLEEEGIFSPSVTRFVIDERRPVSVVHRYRGKDYLVNGRLFSLYGGEPDAVLVQTRNLGEDVLATRAPNETQALLDYALRQLRKVRQEQVRPLDKDARLSRSPVYRRCLDLIERAAAADTTVLLTGETGVGKSWLVSRLHQLSARHDKPLIHVNCAAIPEALLEAELFGHVKGAFTGASREGREGYVALAEGGTLFLDEIGDLPATLQPKLLQLLQERVYHPLGGKPTHADVRIVAATNADLAGKVREGSFRSDLYYRLNIIPVRVPPLRERREDILALARYLLMRVGERLQRPMQLDRSALRALLKYSWPGNVRELENLLERMTVVCDATTITADDLELEVSHEQASPFPVEEGLQDGETLPERMTELERRLVIETLEREGSTRRTARALGVSQSWLMRRIKRYGIAR
ncbi:MULTISPECIES: sigma-54 interaction domain-containing protein [Halomonas]|nr:MULTISPECIES: sigma 54-interacting transcriptional regulator [Halomonas]WBF16884.1 sigma 54-interacting transcriptional regulator [Halomonas elongata]WPU45715.1 sigma 54-interacting transcriptional regulator [Halomonas elongata DSM 2581]SEM37058.1 Transcriptional regulator containing PAS, AAA-type ATPase, and DNA-binding Fis domains [Halomonas caseinilytica]